MTRSTLADNATQAAVAEPALIEVVLSRRQSTADRCQALRRLGLAPHLPLRVVAVSAEQGRDATVETIELMAQKQSSHSLQVGVIGGVVAVLCQEGTKSPSDDLRTALRHCRRDRRAAAGLRIGVGGLIDSSEAEISWNQALVALRFASPRDASGQVGDPGYAVVDYDSLGVLAALAEVPASRLRSEKEVVALDALTATDNGALDVGVLEAFCLTGSLRQAAQVLYLHHSTVATRLARIEKALGWRLDDPADRFKAQFALMARRLAHASTFC